MGSHPRYGQLGSWLSRRWAAKGATDLEVVLSWGLPVGDCRGMPEI